MFDTHRKNEEAGNVPGWEKTWWWKVLVLVPPFEFASKIWSESLLLVLQYSTTVLFVQFVSNFTHVVSFWLTGLAKSQCFSFRLLIVFALYCWHLDCSVLSRPPLHLGSTRSHIAFCCCCGCQQPQCADCLVFFHFLPSHFFLASMSPLASAASVSGILTGLHRCCHRCLCVVLYNFYTWMRTIQSPLPSLFGTMDPCARGRITSVSKFQTCLDLFKHAQTF